MFNKLKIKDKNKRDTLYDIIFVSPQLILYLTFTILPFFVALPIIFTDRRNFLDNNVAYIGFQNFLTIFQEPFISEFKSAFFRSATFTALNYFMTYAFGLTLALIMYEYVSSLKKPFFTIIYMPNMVSGLGAGMFLTLLFSKDTGSLNLLLMELGIIEEALDIKTQMVTIFALPVMTGWRYAGINMAFFLSGLLAIPKESIEAAVVDGVSYWQKLIHIYIPQIIPSIVMVTVTCMIGSFNLIDELIGLGALYGNQNAVFLSVLVFIKGFKQGLAKAVTMSMTVFVPLIIVAFTLIRWQKKKQY